MIETASYPSDFSKLVPEKPFYLELFGETQPLIDMNFAQLLPGGSLDAVAQSETLTSVYQYWWTIGYIGDSHTNYEDPIFPPSDGRFEDSAVNIYMYFPISGGWRIKEVIPTVRYLKPLHEQIVSWSHTSEMLGQAAPLLSAFTGAATFASTFARMVPTPVTSVISLMPVLMSMLAKLHINTVPPVDGFTWTVEKVSDYHKELGLLQGVVWNIPRKMFRELGARLTGSLSMSFIPSHVQQNETVFANKPEFQPKPILAKAIINSSGLVLPDPDRFPGEFDDGFLRLYVAPVS